MSVLGVVRAPAPPRGCARALLSVQAHRLGRTDPRPPVRPAQGFRVAAPLRRPRPAETPCRASALARSKYVRHLDQPGRCLRDGLGLRNAPAPGMSLTASACRRDSSDCRQGRAGRLLGLLGLAEGLLRGVVGPFCSKPLARACTPATAARPIKPASTAAAAGTAVRFRRAHRRTRRESGSRQAESPARRPSSARCPRPGPGTSRSDPRASGPSP